MNNFDYSQEEGRKCPKNEFLSSYFDNELEKTSPEFTHISSCPECLAKIGKFAKIGEIINRNVLNECSPPPTEDMLRKVRDRLHEGKKAETPTYLIQFLKVAAIFVMIVGIFAYVLSINANKALPTTAKGLKTSPASTSISPAPTVVQVPREAVIQKRFMPDNEIQFSDMSNVSTGQGLEFHSQPPENVPAKVKPASIPDYVSHVWTVKNLKDASIEVNDCVTRLGIPAKGINVSKNRDEDSVVTYNMNLSKKQISNFVKLFASAGNELISPAAPQPEQNLFYGNAADPVDYELKLVQKDK